LGLRFEANRCSPDTEANARFVFVAKNLSTSKDFEAGNFFERSEAVRPSNGTGLVFARGRSLLVKTFEARTGKFNALCEEILVRQFVCINP
jgi:hypothetical protein